MTKTPFLQNIDSAWLTFLRVVTAGGMIYGHGLPKISRLMGDKPIKFADPIGIGAEATLVLAIIIEVFCSLLIILGWKTRWAAIPLIIVMLFAVFVIHLYDPFNKKEMAIMYLLTLGTIYVFGPGKYALDNIKSKRYRR